MNTVISEEQQALYALISEAEANVAAMKEKLRAVENELEGTAGEKEKYQLLSDVCKSLDKLSELGADKLFWGEQPGGHDPREQLDRVRESVSRFEKSISGTEQERSSLEKGIEEELWKINSLNEELAEIKEQEQRRLYDFVVEREISKLPYRPMVMPWSSRGEDEQRFRRVLLLTLLFTLLFGYGTYLYELPPPEIDKPVEIPERLAKLVKKPEPPPPPPKKKEEEKKPETEEKKAEKKPTPAEKKKARKKAESSGVLAFKNSFADLIENAPEAKLGADARVTNAGQKAKGQTTQRSIVTAAGTGSGGINTASLSRNVGAGGKGVTGVGFSRVESAIGTDMQADSDRPLSDGPGPSRTDEEIQIVFDRYKATLYRIYNKALRKDPTLQGKLVLRITIEPDGSVSLVKDESTDLASKELVAQILARVKRFNFGPKEGVPKVTILYPIDFLPAS